MLVAFMAMTLISMIVFGESLHRGLKVGGISVILLMVVRLYKGYRRTQSIKRLPSAQLVVEGKTVNYFYQKRQLAVSGVEMFMSIPVNYGILEAVRASNSPATEWTLHTPIPSTIPATITLEGKTFAFKMAKVTFPTNHSRIFLIRYVGKFLEEVEQDTWTGVVMYQHLDVRFRKRRMRVRETEESNWMKWLRPVSPTPA
jgi:hypothetical protein